MVDALLHSPIIPVKRNTLLRILIIPVVVGGIARYVWVSMLSVNSKQSAMSPDSRYMVKVSSKWREGFWTGTAHEYHSVKIETADGRVIRHVVTDELWTGWPKDCSIGWTADSLSVTITCKVEEVMKTRLILDVRP